MENITTTNETTATAITPVQPEARKLPDDYLTDGYYAETEKGARYLKPKFVGEQAETIAKLLSDTKPSDFAGLMREMKRSKKTTLPFEARQTALAEMLPKAIALVHRKKADRILIDLINAHLEAVENDDDWVACYRHLEAVASYLIVHYAPKTDGKKAGDNAC